MVQAMEDHPEGMRMALCYCSGGFAAILSATARCWLAILLAHAAGYIQCAPVHGGGHSPLHNERG